MEKVLRRTALAKAQAARRATIRWQKNKSAEWARTRRTEMVVARYESEDIKTARKVRREDRELGPLAPRRDVGDVQETYGAMNIRRLEGLTKRVRDRKEAQPIVEGDRVVVIEGRDKGRIGRVLSVNRKKHECTVRGLNLVDIVVPEWVRIGEANSSPIRSMEKGIPLPSVRLIHKLTDPETGHARDVIVKEIVERTMFTHKRRRILEKRRVIPGLGIIMPYPAREEKDETEHEIDTLRIDVDRKTWVPTLLTSPMPISVLDELRNKYSKFRDRHDEEYIAKKVAEEREAKATARHMALQVRTPIQAANRKQRAERRAKGYAPLSEAMLAKIGEVMANKGKSMGETKPSPSPA